MPFPGRVHPPQVLGVFGGELEVGVLRRQQDLLTVEVPGEVAQRVVQRPVAGVGASKGILRSKCCVFVSGRIPKRKRLPIGIVCLIGSNRFS